MNIADLLAEAKQLLPETNYYAEPHKIDLENFPLNELTAKVLILAHNVGYKAGYRAVIETLPAREGMGR